MTRQNHAAGTGRRKTAKAYITDGDYERINAAAPARSELLLRQYCPDGRRQGREWVSKNPKRDDSRPGSMSTNMDTGKGGDFALGVYWGDWIAFAAYMEGVPNSEAARILAGILGVPVTLETSTTGGGSALNFNLPAKAQEEPRPVLPIPPEALKTTPRVHPKYGTPSAEWWYRDESGNPILIVLRFDPPNQRKQILPLTYWPDGKWKYQGLPAPRPLYHLDQLAARPDAPIVLCEGEKAADAAAKLLPDFVATTTLNGAGSPHKTDFKPLVGRSIHIWPDADEPGRKYAKEIVRLILEAGK